jgi:uncharacterized membrane protein YdcZ (DUF606 family)
MVKKFLHHMSIPAFFAVAMLFVSGVLFVASQHSINAELAQINNRAEAIFSALNAGKPTN